MVAPLLLAAAPALLDIFGKAVDRIIPDKAAAQKVKDEIALTAQSQDFQLAMAQIAANIEEAKSPSKFIAGWRPAVGWVGVVSLALVYWPKAIFLSGVWVIQAFMLLHNTPDITNVVMPVYPDLGVTDLLGLLASILGLGAMRSVEKVKDAEGNR